VSETVIVIFEPLGKRIEVPRGTNLREAARLAGIVINSPCGGRGKCGNCAVRITQGRVSPSTADIEHFTKQELNRGFRLSCQVKVTEPVVVDVPQAAALSEEQILEVSKVDLARPDPAVCKRFARMPAPTVEDQRSDFDRFLCAIDPACQAEYDFALVRKFSHLIRNSNWEATAVFENGRIVATERGDTTSHVLGLAVDLGTTTIVGALVDLNEGRILGTASRTNPQVAYGDDVVSRIGFASASAANLRLLQGLMAGCINEIIEELVRRNGYGRRDIYEVVAAGNTTMNHLFLRVDPSYVAQAPYVPAFRHAQNVRARELGLKVNPAANVHALPNIAGFVGGDTVAVMLVSRIARQRDVILAIDIGTNGEIVVGCCGRMMAASCAAGPAFEGARIRFGMRAARGAIERVRVNTDIEIATIGQAPPVGICGSGLLETIAELYKVGIIDQTGLIRPADELNGLSESLRRRIRPADGAQEVVLVEAGAGGSSEDIVLAQRDVREFQLAKSAIRSGTIILLDEYGIEPQALDRLVIAGGFGSHIDLARAIAVGLLPKVPPSRFDFIGNGSLGGALMCLLDRKMRHQADSVSRACRYVELASRPEFQHHFAENMLFPPLDGPTYGKAP